MIGGIKVYLKEFVCNHCGFEVEEHELLEFDGDMICEECFDTETDLCHDCGERECISDLIDVKSVGDNVCRNCLDNSYVFTVCCSEWIHIDDAIVTDDSHTAYCDVDCLYDDDGGFFCGDCDGAYTEDSFGGYNNNDDRVCYDCYEENHSSNIRSYHDNPDVEFYGTPSNDRYFGVELELDNGDAYSFSEDINEYTDPRLYLMEDGSLDGGVEVVSQPMSLTEHLTNGMWEDVRENALNNGLLSHDTRTCGLHIHVSREGISGGGATIDNIVFIVERFWSKFMTFSRRTQSEINDWARRYTSKNSDLIYLNDIKKADKFGKYHAVNISPYKTIEFRLFKGTLKLNTLKASLEMVDHICNVAEKLSEDELDKLTWTEFIEMAGNQYMYLFHYLTERNIMPNEEECKAVKVLRERIFVDVLISKAKAVVNSKLNNQADNYNQDYFEHLSDVINYTDIEFDMTYNMYHDGDLITLRNVANNIHGCGGEESFTYLSNVLYTEGSIVYLEYGGHAKYAASRDMVLRVYNTKDNIKVKYKSGLVIKPKYITTDGSNILFINRVIESSFSDLLIINDVHNTNISYIESIELINPTDNNAIKPELQALKERLDVAIKEEDIETLTMIVDDTFYQVEEDVDNKSQRETLFDLESPYTFGREIVPRSYNSRFVMRD